MTSVTRKTKKNKKMWQFKCDLSKTEFINSCTQYIISKEIYLKGENWVHIASHDWHEKQKKNKKKKNKKQKKMSQFK